MALKSILSFLFLSAVLASPFADRSEKGPAACEKHFIEELREDPNATPYCSKYLMIPTITSTAYATYTPPVATATAVSTKTDRTTITTTGSTTTTVTTTATTTTMHTATCTPSAGVFKRESDSDEPEESKKSSKKHTSKTMTTSRHTASASAVPKCMTGKPSSSVSSACSCLMIPTPTTTVTISATLVPLTTTTSTTASTTETAYTTTITTFTAPTTTTTTVDATTTVLFTKNGQYTTTDGSIFFLYPGTDFAGYDEFAGPCYAGNTVPFFNGVTTRPCQSYNDCLENCAAGRGAPQPCLGVSYTPNGVYGGLPSCFLKFAVPGNGAPGCGAVQPNFVVDSAIYSGKV